MSCSIPLQQHDTSAFAGLHRLLVPEAGLHLPDVTGADHHHAQAALADAAADGQGQLPRQ